MLEKSVAELIYYAKKHLFLEEMDAVYFTNILLHHFGKIEPYAGEIPTEEIEKMDVPDRIVNDIMDDLQKEGMDEREAERMVDWAFGIVTPNPSLINVLFDDLKARNPEFALAFLKDVSTKNYYFQKTKMDRNITWVGTFDDGPSVGLSINLSKPEKSNKDIAKLLTSTSVNYPKCALCLENLGYYGDDKHAARETIRFVPITIAGERWYLQYSPYGYFENHCICFKEDHIPMKIERKTFERLFDFVAQFPSFFMGSNSDLPIVGGSILNHEHFQGGSPTLPLFKAKERECLFETDKKTTVAVVDYYMNTIKIRGTDQEEIISIGEKILNDWRTYDNEPLGVIHETEGKRHNTVTSYAIRKGDEYSLYLVLRCNIVSEEFPDGVFHSHPEFHAIKKEGIGLIEAGGLFILPARLKRQMGEVKEALSLSKEEYLKKYKDLDIFDHMIATMKNTGMTAEDYMKYAAREILRNAAIFKENEKDQKELKAFVMNAIEGDTK